MLSPNLYAHFMTLHTAIRILSSSKYVTYMIDYVNDLLLHIVTQFGRLYGDEYISYNIHNLIHLSEDCRRYGHLDLFSTFTFENSFQVIKKIN